MPAYAKEGSQGRTWQKVSVHTEYAEDRQYCRVWYLIHDTHGVTDLSRYSSLCSVMLFVGRPTYPSRTPVDHEEEPPNKTVKTHPTPSLPS